MGQIGEGRIPSGWSGTAVGRPARAARRDERNDATVADSSLIEKVTTSRPGAIAVGIVVAVIAAILLIVYVTRYKSSVDSTAAAVPVLVAKNLIPKGTPGTSVASKGLYQSTSVPSDKVAANAISDPASLSGRVAISDIYPGAQLTLDNFSAEASTALSAQLAGRERALTLSIDAVHGSLANVAAGDRVDIYTQTTRGGRLVTQLFRSNVLVLQAPGSAGGAVVLRVPTADASNVLFASVNTTLFFVIRPATGAAPTAPSIADQGTVNATSGTR
jgi:Flp pilus assembly protein CpaB